MNMQGIHPQNVIIHITGITGTQHMKQQFDLLEADNQQLQINTSALAKGIYLVKVTNHQKVLYRGSFVKQ
jgi:hypothetical protein